MPITPTYPGVYIEELPSGVRTIIGVATSITAFIGRALRGSCNEPTRVQSYADFERTFGGLWVESTMSYTVQQYFENGGTDAIIVRVVHSGDATATDNAVKATVTANELNLEAASEGDWGNDLRVRLDDDTRDLETGESAGSLFNLTVKDNGTGEIESFRNVSTDASHKRYVKQVLELESALVRVTGSVPTTVTPHASVSAGADPFADALSGTAYDISNDDGDDGDDIDDTDILGVESSKTGLYALENTDLFNLLCIPPLTREDDILTATYVTALAYCKKRRAVLIVDSPANWDEVSDIEDTTSGVDSLGLRDENSVIYFPRIKVPDKLKEFRMETFVPCGAVAGIMARTDAQRGVWKAPAGLDAKLVGVQKLTVKLTDGDNGRLNPLGVNCLRSFPVYGNIVWGARTLEGADKIASEWKYLPVRRTALFIEESLYRGTQWVVFEPNDEPLWAQIRLNVGAFMHDLFAKGAFQGTSPKEAYFVKCDKDTTTQNDIDKGVVNILVGFAPLKPAEFVIIKIQQIAGNIET
ncbi:MAG: phage tail protein [Chloroflexi bacterium RBG_13_51_52]|nr:MAG: phage tail protein [Chloroflexi bacterium RBG_13_51_52]